MDALVKDPYETEADFKLRQKYTSLLFEKLPDKDPEKIISLGRIGTDRMIYDVEYPSSLEKQIGQINAELL